VPPQLEMEAFRTNTLYARLLAPAAVGKLTRPKVGLSTD